MAERATQAELARMHNVSRQAIHELVSRGILAKADDGKIDVELARLAITNRLSPNSKTSAAITPTPQAQAAAPQSPAQTDEQAAVTSYHVAKTMNEAAQARMNQLKLAEMQGNLILVSAVRTKWASLLTSMQQMVMQVAPRLAPVLAHESDPLKVQQLLEAEMHELLTAISQSQS